MRKMPQLEHNEVEGLYRSVGSAPLNTDIPCSQDQECLSKFMYGTPGTTLAKGLLQYYASAINV